MSEGEHADPPTPPVPREEIVPSEAAHPPVGADPFVMREPAHRVSPRALWLWRVEGLLSVLPVAVALGLWGWLDGERRTAQVVVGALLVLWALVEVLVVPPFRFRVHRWEVTDLAVYTQSGFLRQERRIAPISRIQTVDSQFGAVERLFGLGTLTVTTASAAGALRVAGLTREHIEALVVDLTAVTAATAGDAT